MLYVQGGAGEGSLMHVRSSSSVLLIEVFLCLASGHETHESTSSHVSQGGDWSVSMGLFRGFRRASDLGC